MSLSGSVSWALRPVLDMQFTQTQLGAAAVPCFCYALWTKMVDKLFSHLPHPIRVPYRVVAREWVPQRVWVFEDNNLRKFCLCCSRFISTTYCLSYFSSLLNLARVQSHDQDITLHRIYAWALLPNTVPLVWWIETHFTQWVWHDKTKPDSAVNYIRTLPYWSYPQNINY